MKKNLKLVLALIVAVMMIVSSISAIAADGDAIVDSNGEPAFESKITISGLAEGDVVHLYKVIGWVGNEANLEAAARTNVGGWKAEEKYVSYLTKDKMNEILVGDTTTGTKPTGITSAIAGDLAVLANADTAVADLTVAEGASSVEYTIPADQQGMYMAIITPKDVNTVYNPVFVSADNFEGGNVQSVPATSTYSDNAAAKKSTLKVEKESTATEDNWDNNDEGDTVAIGDTVSFTVTSNIPGYGEVYDNPTFILKDTMTTGLALDTNSVTITKPAGLVEGPDKDYTITKAATGYTITFTSAYLRKNAEAQDLEVTYTAKVTTDAPKNVNVEKNTVEISYSHNPQSDTSGGSDTDLQHKKDTTQHYTFTIDASSLAGNTSASGKKGSEIIKVGVDAAGNPINSTVRTSSEITEEKYVTSPLAEAEFRLYTDAACENEYIPKKADGTAKYEANTPAGIITSDANGRLQITGLDAGTYYLKETKAPAGYIKAADAVKIEIKATMVEQHMIDYYKKGQATAEWWNDTEANQGNAPSGADAENWVKYEYDTEILQSYTVKVNDQDAATHTFMHESSNTEIKWSDTGVTELPSSIHNTKGVELPSTGGIGTTIFYVGGSILVLAAAILLVTKRRMGVED